jgi:hypothetical protein
MVVDADGDYGIAKVIITVNERDDHKPKANPDGAALQSINRLPLMFYLTIPVLKMAA